MFLYHDMRSLDQVQEQEVLDKMVSILMDLAMFGVSVERWL